MGYQLRLLMASNAAETLVMIVNGWSVVRRRKANELPSGHGLRKRESCQLVRGSDLTSRASGRRRARVRVIPGLPSAPLSASAKGLTRTYVNFDPESCPELGNTGKD